MSDFRQTADRTNPYKRGADDGFVFGGLLCAIFFGWVFSVRVPLLGLVAFGLMASVPFLIYRWLRRSYVADGGLTLMSSLWVQGITTFTCGGMISGLVSAVYLRWIEPGFILERVNEAIGFYSDFEGGEETARVLQQMLDAHLMPSTIAIVIEMIMLCICSGSLLSALMAVLVRARGITKRKL